jgi:hypothetical protein
MEKNRDDLTGYRVKSFAQGTRLSELAVFAATAVISGLGRLTGILHLLACHAKTHAGNRLASGLGYRRPAFIAFAQTFAAWQLAACTLNSVLDGGVDLILYGPVFGKTTGHDYLLNTRFAF